MIYFFIGSRAALALIFVVACISKVQNASSYREFFDSLKDFGLPSVLQRIVSLVVPAVEGLTLLLLVVNRTGLWGLVASAVLLSSFTAGISVARARGRVVRCRCFGASDAPAEGGHVARNVALLGIALAGIVTGLGAKGQLVSANVILAIGLGLITAALFLRWQELSFLLKSPSSPRSGSSHMPVNDQRS
jgi:hypothetical protein